LDEFVAIFSAGKAMNKIRVGATVTPALFAVLANGELDIDHIKVDADEGLETLNRALAHRPVFLHDISSRFWLNYEDPFDEAEMTPARHMLDVARPPWFSTGIGASAEPQGHTTPYWRGAPASARQSRPHALANIVRNGRRLRTWLDDMPLLLENYNYHPTNAYDYICEPETFCALVDEIGCEVLLDLAHAQISAHNLGWPDAKSYLQALPLQLVREIHINRPAYDDGLGQMLDRHLPIQEDDLPLLLWTLERTPAVAVTLESESPSEAVLLHEIALLRRALA
jgi:uncharacterized protein (UPF0276 family)